MFVAGVVLAAGSSKRLGTPKQLLPFRGATLLDASLDAARACSFDQLLVTVGGASEEVRTHVDLTGAEPIENADHEKGCSSSLAAALRAIDDRADGIVVMLGDQPGVRPDAVTGLIAGAAGAALGVCRYDDGLGHPMWCGREVFPELFSLHGDKAVWKLRESGRYSVAEVLTSGSIPRDVDTWEDYEALLAADAAGAVPGDGPAG